MTGAEPRSPGDDPASADKGLPVLPPLTAMIEIVVLFALIYGLDQLTPNLAILDLSPHPFWIPVLLVSLQYGTVSGFIAAVAAIGLSLFSGLPEQDIGENLFAYFLRVLGQPILWIGVALLVGQFRMRQLSAKLELRQSNRALTLQRDDLARHARELRTRVEHLEQELATRYAVPPHAIAGILAQTMDAGGLRSDADAMAVLQKAATILFPDATIVAYELRDGLLSERAVSGRRPDSGPRIRITGDDPLFGAVILAGRTVSVLDRAGEHLVAQTGLAATPIPAGLRNEAIPATTAAVALGANGIAGLPPYGMLVIESAAPSTVTPEGVLALELLAHALAPRPQRKRPAASSILAQSRRVRLPTTRDTVRRPSELVHVRGDARMAPDVPRPTLDRRTSLIERLRRQPDVTLPTSLTPPLAASAGTIADGSRAKGSGDQPSSDASKSASEP